MKARSQIRVLLKEATDPVHRRLHNHEGLGAVASGAIGIADYTKLLMRLFGFHKPFDAMIENAGPSLGIILDMESRKRAGHIAEDLETMNVGAAAISRIPQCREIFHPRTVAEFMGSLYVVEGSTLGGMQLARALTPLFGTGGTEGRRFFFGYGERHSTMWQEFLQALDAIASDPQKEAEIVHGALRTFDDFERWMNGWREPAIVTKLPSSGDSALEDAR